MQRQLEMMDARMNNVSSDRLLRANRAYDEESEDDRRQPQKRSELDVEKSKREAEEPAGRESRDDEAAVRVDQGVFFGGLAGGAEGVGGVGWFQLALSGC